MNARAQSGKTLGLLSSGRQASSPVHAVPHTLAAAGVLSHTGTRLFRAILKLCTTQASYFTRVHGEVAQPQTTCLTRSNTLIFLTATNLFSRMKKPLCTCSAGRLQLNYDSADRPLQACELSGHAGAILLPYTACVPVLNPSMHSKPLTMLLAPWPSFLRMRISFSEICVHVAELPG